jgi:hypothetical protein
LFSKKNPPPPKKTVIENNKMDLSNLTDPLLLPNDDNDDQQNNMASSEWSDEEAKKAKLFIPDIYNYGFNQEAKCWIRFDADRKVLLVVSEDIDEILDVIDPNDIIAADVEIKLFGSGEESRSVHKRAIAFSNTSMEEEKEKNKPDKKEGNDCGIFQPLKEDTEKIFSACNNEPLSNIPFDTQAAAVLSIYVYPRLDSSQLSWFDWCGLTSSHKSSPNTNQSEAAAAADRSKLGNRYAHIRQFQVAPAEDFSYISKVGTVFLF